MDILLKIKRLVLRGRVLFTNKARLEMDRDSLAASDVVEAILNAQGIDKVIRSRRPNDSRRGDKLYVLKGFNYSGTLIYTKGRLGRDREGEILYVLVSSKIATIGE